MSCFKGRMEEYSSIAIDRFDGKNVQCTAFFLSHCHKDHMVGLGHPAFREHLSSRQDVFLYCTEVSRILLLADEEYMHLEKFIRTLDVGSTHHICVPKGTELRDDIMVGVTLVSAGHCPGSVMFLFEGKEGTVLYTGDFRWEVNQAIKISAFREGSNVKPLKSLYIDTTFCIPEAFHIPSRSECLEATADLVSNWLGQNKFHVVSLSCPAKFGHEHLLAELGKRLNTKIHVSEWKVNIYNQIPELKEIFSSDPRECRIHACSWKGFSRGSCLSCGYTGPGPNRVRVLNVRPSTMWFTSSKTRANTKDLVVAPASHRGLHRVCYSMHSSYSEIRDVVSFLQPARVFPNVLPASDSDMTAVQARLNGFLKIPHKARFSSANSASGKGSFQPLGLLKTQKDRVGKTRFHSGDSSSEELVFSSQEPSPTKIRNSQIAADKNDSSCHSRSQQMQNDVLSKSSGSSYVDSFNDKDEELNLFSDEDEGHEDKDKSERLNIRGEDVAEEESLRLYISGESEVDDTDEEDERDIPSNAVYFTQEVGLAQKSDSKPCTPSDKLKLEHFQNQERDQSTNANKQHYDSYDRIGPDECEIDDDESSDSEIIANSQEFTTSVIPFSRYIGSPPRKANEHTSHNVRDDEKLEIEGKIDQKCPNQLSPVSPTEQASYQSTNCINKQGLGRTDGNLTAVASHDDKTNGAAIISNNCEEQHLMPSKEESTNSYSPRSETLVYNVDNMNCLKVNSSSKECDSSDDVNLCHLKTGKSTEICSFSNPNKEYSAALTFSSKDDKRVKQCNGRSLNASDGLESDDDYDCLIVSSTSCKKSRSELSDSSYSQKSPSVTKMESADFDVKNVSRPNITSFKQGFDWTPIEKKRRLSSNSDEESSSVEFLYECPKLSDEPQGQGWLSKESPRQRPIKATAYEIHRRKKTKHRESSSHNNDHKPHASESLHTQTIDLTLDD